MLREYEREKALQKELDHTLQMRAWVFYFSSHNFDHHSRCSKFATGLPAIRVRPYKIIPTVWASETGLGAIVEPPSSLVSAGTVVVTAFSSVVVLVSGWETHVAMEFQRGVGERIAGISTVSWEAKGIFVVFRIKIKGIVIGVVPSTACIELYLHDITALS